MTSQTTSALRDATEKRPVTQTLRVLAGRWKPVVIYHRLRVERLRYTALRERLTGVVPKVLTHQLRELVADGVLARSPASGAAARVEYALTDRGLARAGRGGDSRLGLATPRGRRLVSPCGDACAASMSARASRATRWF